VKIYEGLLQKGGFNIYFPLSPDGKWIAYSPEVVDKVRPESTLCEADFDEILRN